MTRFKGQHHAYFYYEYLVCGDRKAKITIAIKEEVLDTLLIGV